MTEQNKTKVPAELIPAGDYPVVSTDAVMDKQKGKTQEEVNEQIEQVKGDKEYDASAFSGLGRKNLTKNVVGVKNVLTQAMMSEANTIYVIQYDYDLNGQTITIPEGCTLEFDGGSIIDNTESGSIVGNNTIIKAAVYKIFAPSITFNGTWKIDEVYPEWFGAKHNTMSTEALQAAITNAIVFKSEVVFNGDYYIINPIEIKKTVRIDGRKHKLIVQSTLLTSCISIEDVGTTAATYGEGNYITIKNLIFNNDYSSASTANGILIKNSSVSYMHLSNLTFQSFKSACIQLVSTGGGYNSQGVYAHNMIIEHIYTFGCSSIIGQVKTNSVGSNPYIYGGVINDVHYEGNHKADSNEYILDLSKFRNMQISNIIIEGFIQKKDIYDNPELRKKGVIRFTRPNTINKLYFELRQSPADQYLDTNAVPTNSICIEADENCQMKIDNVYGNYPSQFLLKNVQLTVSAATPSELPEVRRGELDSIVDNMSENYKLTLENGYYGTNMKTYGGNYDASYDIKRISKNVYHKSIILNSSSGLSLSVDDSEPLINVDLSELKKIDDYSASNKYKNTIGIWSSGSLPTFTYSNDIRWGNILTLTSTREDNFLRSGIQTIKANIGVAENEWYTLVTTVRVDSVPTTGNKDKYFFRASGGPQTCFYGTREKGVGNIITYIFAGRNTGTSYTLIQFDSPETGDTVEVPQQYTILDIAIFKGLHYGKCKSKIFTEPSF